MKYMTRARRRAAAVTAAVLLAAALPAAGGEAQPDRAQLEKQLDEARTRLDAAAQDVARLSGELYGSGEPDLMRMMMLHGEPRGAMLGVNIAGSGTREEGVEVVGVSPGGPAEAAGIRAGDVILSVNGQDLKKKDGRAPSSQLVAYMRAVEPGQSVKVQYLRDGKRLTADVKTTAATPRLSTMMQHGGPMEMLEGMPLPLAEGMMMRRHGFGSLELVPMTPGLGKYFGTDKGLLVVRAPREPGLGLAEGDVVFTIGDRTPENPGQAFRILQSYDAGEKVKLGILRDRKRLEIEGTLPDAPPMRDHLRGTLPPPPPGGAAPPPPRKDDSA